jgi:beta-glucanase (GH16 family)
LLALTVAAGCSAPDTGRETRSEEPESTSPTPAPEQATGRPADTVRLSLLPGVSQPGDRAAPPPEGALLVATVDPARTGGDVVLQEQTRGGWQTVARAQQDVAGVARFPGSQVDGASDGTFRAAAVDPDGSRGQVSNEVGGAGWTAVFDDQFDGTSLDTTRWGYRSLGLYNPEDDGKCAKSDESAVQVADGTLRLQVRRDPERADEQCRTPHGTLDYYLNGRIDTEGQFGFTYGVAAARVKFQRGAGQHGAFWLQRGGAPLVPGDPGSSGAEIDVAEFFGEGTKDGGMATYVYYTDAQGEMVKIGGRRAEATRQLPPGDSWWTRFHVFSVEWTPEGYVYRVDGREISRISQGVSGVDEFLVLSLSSKDWELPKLQSSMLPSTMEVDWVRVWQRAGS